MPELPHQSSGEREPWRMPEWMEPYRDLIESDLGGNTIENLLNDTTTNGFNNVIRSALICMGEAKVRMLHGLHKRGLLVTREVARDA